MSSDPFSASRIRISGDQKTYLFGQAVYPLNGRFSRAKQNHFQLVVVLSGSIKITADRTNYQLAPGDAILQQPGHRELYRFAEKEITSHTWCEITPKVISARDKALLHRAVGVHKAPASIHLLIEEGLAVTNHETADTHLAMQALARACILRFAAHACAMDKKAQSAPLHPAFERAIEIVTTQFTKLRSSKDVAQRAGISLTQLRSLFHQAKSESLPDMIWRLKAEHAIQLLRSTGLTLNEIADHCGYANAFHLSRSIKLRTGYSPRNLRNTEWHRKKN